MGYVDDFRSAIPDTEQSFPPYLFTMLDLARKADTEVETLKKENSDLNKTLDEVKADLKTAQETNLETLINSTPESAESTVEESVDTNEIPTLSEIMGGVENGDLEIV